MTASARAATSVGCPLRPELSLDNDLILWGLPAALGRWLGGAAHAVPVVAEDVRASYGVFAPLSGRAYNLGLRALPAGFDLEWRIRTVLRRIPAMLRSELDEQGLQASALSLDREPDTVGLDEVSICSPFPPHMPDLGRCGAHFVGINARSVLWSYEGRPAIARLEQHWTQWRDTLGSLVGAVD